MTRKQKKTAIRIGIAAVLLIAATVLSKCMTLPFGRAGALAVYLVPYFVIGWDILRKAGRNMLHGQICGEHFLMCIATVGAFVLGENAEAVFVMLFYQVGELFQNISVGKSRKSIADLMHIRPDRATVRREDGWVSVSPEEVAVGETVLVRPGEKIPLDGTVLSGAGTVNTVALTGEAVPSAVKPGDSVLSGCVNENGTLEIAVEKPFGESTVSKILSLVENAGSRKAKSEQFITRFARWYTPSVVGSAVLLAVLPMLFGVPWRISVHRALLFLVVSCPCALVISVPLAFFAGIGRAAKQGILIKGANYMETLANCTTLAFDKTGTLTQGTFTVTECHPRTGSAAELLCTAALAECHSTHPIAVSLRAAAGELPEATVTDVQEDAGKGLSATVNGRKIWVGNAAWMQEHQIETEPTDAEGTVVFVAEAGVYLGYLVIADTLKPDAAAAIQAAKALGIRKTVLLSGDRAHTAKAVADALQIDEVYAELLPADKVTQMEKLLATGEKVAFVGDGINDAPVLTRADIGIAMGALGSDAAIEAADVVLMDDRPLKIADAIRLARSTHRKVVQNIAFALTVKIAVLLLGALGIVGMFAAVFADVGVAFLAILNATR